MDRRQRRIEEKKNMILLDLQRALETTSQLAELISVDMLNSAIKQAIQEVGYIEYDPQQYEASVPDVPFPGLP